MERGLAARMRALGFLEMMSWGLLVVGAFVIRDVVDRSVPIEPVAAVLCFVAFVGTPIALRVLVAIEYVEATPEGLRWRTLFVSRELPWDRVAQIGMGDPGLFPWLLWLHGLPWGLLFPTEERAVKVRLTNGRVWCLRASVSNRRRADAWLRALPMVMPAREGRQPPSLDGTITLDPSRGN